MLKVGSERVDGALAAGVVGVAGAGEEEEAGWAGMQVRGAQGAWEMVVTGLGRGCRVLLGKGVAVMGAGALAAAGEAAGEGEAVGVVGWEGRSG